MKKSTLLLIIILLISALLRLQNLSHNPPALYGDEISFAWNAWNILHTGKDEYNVAYPIHFKAFNDYKSPIPVYLLVPVFWIFGMSEMSIRMPVALFSLFTVFMTYKLGEKLINKKVGLLSALLLGISSWHVHLSRGYFEATIALCFMVLGIYLFIAAHSVRRILLAIFFLATCLYTYFTPRIILIFLIPFLFLYRAVIEKKKILREAIIAFIFLLILAAPLLYVTLFDHGLNRIEGLLSSRNLEITKEVEASRNLVGNEGWTVKLLHNKPLYWIKSIINDYLAHFSINFWYLEGDSSLRYFLGNMGMFYLIELPFVLWGFVTMYTSHKSAFVLIVGWMLIAPIPAAISGRPFAVRSLGLLPIPFFLVAFGLIEARKKAARLFHTVPLSIIIGTIAVGFSMSFGYYLVRYHEEYQKYAANWWGDENKQAIQLAMKEESNYDYIFLSNFYTGIDLALAVYDDIDPVLYKQAKVYPATIADRSFMRLGKYYIGSLDIDPTRLNQGLIPPNSLYIARPEEFPSSETIRAKDDGRVLFYVHRTDTL